MRGSTVLERTDSESRRYPNLGESWAGSEVSGSCGSFVGGSVRFVVRRWLASDQRTAQK